MTHASHHRNCPILFSAEQIAKRTAELGRRNNADWAQRILPQMVKHMLATAPPGADTTSWRY